MKTVRALVVTIICLLGCSVVFAQSNVFPERHILSLLNDTSLDQAVVSFVAKDAATGKTLVSYNANKSMVPASIQKLLTTGVALETLDSTYTFNTSVGYRGEVTKNGTLVGDLVIVGSGDPTMGSAYFGRDKNKSQFLYNWAWIIKNMGINRIDGRIVVDITHFEDWPIVGTWTYEDLGNYYGAGIFPLTMFDNICELHFSSPATVGAKTTFKYCWPAIPYLNIENQVYAGRGGDNAYVFQSPTSEHMIVRGDITAAKNDFVVKACIPDPPRVFADMLSFILDSIGVKQTCKPVIAKLPGDYQNNNAFCELFIHQSPSLSKIVEQTNKNSVNLFAEHLLKESGWCASGSGSTQEGVNTLYAFFNSHGIDTKGVSLVDGSGLSRFNLMTASFMTDLLVYYKAKSPASMVIYQSLPVSGKTGTLETFGRKTVVAGRVHAKTGSMTRVKNLAGYLETRSGRTIAFAFMANNYCCGGSKVRTIQEDIMKAMYEY